MIDPVDIRFFKALQQVCAGFDDIEQTCRDAIDKAIKTGDPLDMRSARQALDALDEPIRDKVLMQVHRHMATDLSAIWSAHPSAKKDPLPN